MRVIALPPGHFPAVGGAVPSSLFDFHISALRTCVLLDTYRISIGIYTPRKCRTGGPENAENGLSDSPVDAEEISFLHMGFRAASILGCAPGMPIGRSAALRPRADSQSRYPSLKAFRVERQLGKWTLFRKS